MNHAIHRTLTSVKVLLNLHDDNSKDMVLIEIIETVYQRLLAYTGYKELPEVYIGYGKKYHVVGITY